MKPSKESGKVNGGERIFHFRPALFFAVFLMLGILFAYLRGVENVSAWWILAVVCPVGLVAALCGDFYTACKRVAWIGLAFLVGSVAFGWQLASFESATAYDGEYAVQGRVWEMERGETLSKIVLTDLAVNGENEDGKMTVYLERTVADALCYADEVRFCAYVQTTANVKDGYGFRAEKIADGVRFTANGVSDFTVTGNRFSVGAFLRQKISETVRAGMDETPAALTLAVLLGDTSGIDEGLLENVRKGGIAHVFAVSGLHIGSLFAFCLLLLKKSPLPKAARFLIVAAVLFLYGSVCGFSASVIRAVVTCLILYACRLLGWKLDGLESLAAACIAVLLLFPSLLFGVGFQLSFLSCLGIALLGKRLASALLFAVDGVGAWLAKKYLKKEAENRAYDPLSADVPPPSLGKQMKTAIVGTVSVGLSAQLATTPVLLNSFGYVSFIGTFLNMLFVPLVSACFGVLLVCVLAACLFSPLGGAILFAPNVVVSALILPFQTTELAGALVGCSVSAETLIAYFTLLFVLSDKINLTKGQRLWLALLLGVCVLLAFIINLL